jgi:hypothetical protein
MDSFHNGIVDVPGILIFEVGRSEFCIDVNFIYKFEKKFYDTEPCNESFRTNKITHSDPYEYIIDLNDLFKIEKKRQNYFFIIRTIMFAKKISLIVDSVLEFITIDTIFIEKSLDINKAESAEYIKWILNYKNRNISIPDYEKIAKSINPRSRGSIIESKDILWDNKISLHNQN